ncbi:MAG: hypothetical protein WEE50_04225 [Chloroflexota bacterium]
MGMLVLLVEDAEVTISATTSQHLARIGVSHVELLQDAHTTAIVLQGWAFDPGPVDAIVQAVMPGLVVRTLRPVMRIVVGEAVDELLLKGRARPPEPPLDRRAPADRPAAAS